MYKISNFGKTLIRGEFMKGKIKLFVVPTAYVLALVLFVFSLYFTQKLFSNIFAKDVLSDEEVEYVDNEIIDDNNYLPVVDTIETIAKPYISSEVRVNKKFYDYKAEEANQKDSIIYYENTYMQSSGVSYSSTSSFDVVSVLGGTIIDVKNDSVMGNIVEIRHNNDLISVYHNLGEVFVNVDDVVFQGQVIGKSGKSNLNVECDNNLHFELYYMGNIVNPEEYYGKSLTDL